MPLPERLPSVLRRQCLEPLAGCKHDANNWSGLRWQWGEDSRRRRWPKSRVSRRGDRSPANAESQCCATVGGKLLKRYYSDGLPGPIGGGAVRLQGGQSGTQRQHLVGWFPLADQQVCDWLVEISSVGFVGSVLCPLSGPGVIKEARGLRVNQLKKVMVYILDWSACADNSGRGVFSQIQALLLHFFSQDSYLSYHQKAEEQSWIWHRKLQHCACWGPWFDRYSPPCIPKE